MIRWLILIVAVGACAQSALAAQEKSRGLSCLWCLLGSARLVGTAKNSMVNLGIGLKKLNDHLIQNVQKTDLEANLAEVAHYLESHPNEPDQPFAKALKLFYELKNNDLCTERTMWTLNLVGTVPAVVLERVDDIIYLLRKKIHLECRDTYLEVVQSRYERMNKSKLELVKTFIDNLYAHYYRAKTNAFEILKKPEVIMFGSGEVQEAPARIIFEKILEISRTDEDEKSKLLVNETGKVSMNTFIHFFDKYLTKPCEEHNKYLNLHLFEPIFDEGSQLDFANVPEHMAYYTTYVRYGTCRMLLSARSDNDFFAPFARIFEDA